MTTLYLEAGSEKIAPASPFPDLEQKPLYHQMRTLAALREHDLVINTYDTGTGKTRASLLYLFDLHKANNQSRHEPNQNVLFVAPTNALLAQHAEDIEKFVDENGLDFQVLRITAQDIRDLESGLRAGETLQRLVQNPLEFDPSAVQPRPFIAVVNPDIYYYAMYFKYGRHDRRNVFMQFLTRFNYIVIDEFHYYDSKQLANFLFFFTLFDKFGYFDQGRKLCLLSATPANRVLCYLERLFGAQGERWVIIAKENEPPESAGLETLPTLAPLELTVVGEEIQAWVRNRRDDLVHWVLEDGLDGAVISSALWRVNEMYAMLCGVLSETRMGRITGPEPQETRAAAVGRSLIFASPTVDIGYNFEKLGKDRQNIDFLLCDSRFGDGLLQRLGRAGRVLGKPITHLPSQAIAFLPEEAARRFEKYDGQTLSRAAFKAIVKQLEAEKILPEKHTLYAYIHSHAVTESFWPIYQMGKMLSQKDRDTLEELYARLIDVFAPGSRRTSRSLEFFFKVYEHRENWLAEAKRASKKLPAYTVERLADWIAWMEPEQGRPDPKQLEGKVHLDKIWRSRSKREALVAFVEGQVALTRAMFNFRDSFQGPVAVVHDPQRLLSGETVNQYDLFHLLSFYTCNLLDEQQFRERCPSATLKGDFYIELKAHREQKVVVTFSYYPEDIDRDGFEERYCCGEVVSLSGLRVVMRERGGDIIQTPQQIVQAIEQQHIPALITAERDQGAVRSTLRGTNLWARDLAVDFGDKSREYRVFMGTAAFHVQAALYSYFMRKQRMQALEKTNAFII